MSGIGCTVCIKLFQLRKLLPSVYILKKKKLVKKGYKKKTQLKKPFSAIELQQYLKMKTSFALSTTFSMVLIAVVTFFLHFWHYK